MKTLIIIFMLVALMGCSSLNRADKIENQSLTIDQSKKSDVIDQIGLPTKVKKHMGFEYWYYFGRADFRHIVIPIPIGANYSSFVDVGPDIKLNFVPMLTCVFDKDAILRAAYKPQSGQEQ